jgi:hypothetical protein
VEDAVEHDKDADLENPDAPWTRRPNESARAYDAFVLHVFSGYTIGEIASKLDVHRVTIHNYQARHAWAERSTAYHDAAVASLVQSREVVIRSLWDEAASIVRSDVLPAIRAVSAKLADLESRDIPPALAELRQIIAPLLEIGAASKGRTLHVDARSDGSVSVDIHDPLGMHRLFDEVLRDRLDGQPDGSPGAASTEEP